MKDKKRIIIISIIVILIIVAIMIISKKNKIVFYLNGEDNMTIKYGSEFIDPGFTAQDGFGNDLSENVIVNNNINNIVSGVYQVKYELNYKNKTEVLERIVTVSNITADDLEIKLNGSEETYVLKDTSYDEEGAVVYNKFDNSIFSSAELLISGNVDTSKIGEYTVNYQLEYNGNKISTNRKVIVVDIPYHITPESLTSNKIKITLDLSSISNYSYVKLPDNYTVLNKNVLYEVNKNGEYTFIIVLSNKQQLKKIVTISNIIGNYTCSGEVTTNGTKIEVKPTSSEIKSYEWIIDNKSSNGTNVFTINKSISSAQVNLIFQDNQKYQVNCTVADKLLYHFKYDENNTKPFIRRDTYTSQDKTRLDALLKAVVNESGYGSRAGVVAAARFLVGGLDYKIPYQGGVYYNRVGLNIGSNNSWGSSGVGLDCYSFVVWARVQNGLTDDALYSGKKYNTADEINKIKVGDYLLSPCTSGSCKNPYKINHIALVIGIDDNYIYVAEETTGNINALVVSKVDKKNPPTKYNLSLVRHVDYPSEGNVTNMWMS